MPASESETIHCANLACKCYIEPGKTVCSEYCAAVEGWSSEVQNEVCGCGHPDCKAAAAEN